MITSNAALSDHKSRPSEILETLQSLDPFIHSKWLFHKQYPVGCYFHRLLKRILLSHRVTWETRSFQKIVLKAKTFIYKPISYPLIYLSSKKQLNNIVNSLKNWHFKIPLFLNIGQRKSILSCNLIKRKKKLMSLEMKIMKKLMSISTQFKVFFWHAQPRFYHLHGKIIIKQVDWQFKKGSMAKKRDNE